MEQKRHWHPELDTIKPLPKVKSCRPIACTEIQMDNGDTYVIKVGDVVSIKFIQNDERVIVRRGRVHDIRVSTKRCMNTDDNISNIILDCSQQFSQKIIEIKIKDVLEINHYNHEYEDLNEKDKIEHGYIEGPHYPVREGGLEYKGEKKFCESIVTPDKDDVTK